MRDIVSCFTDPLKHWYRTLNRALRFLLFSLGFRTQTLANQGDIVTVARKRFQMLHKNPEGQSTCIQCGSKKNQLCLQKVDASAFFTKVDQNRIFAKVARMADMALARGTPFIWIPRKKAKHCRFSDQKPSASNHWSFVHVDEIKGTLEFLRKDRYFRAGDTIVLQTTGVAMGQILSPIFTMVDLELAWHDHVTDRCWLMAQPWANMATDICRVLAAMLHVDDGLFGSLCLCSSCMLCIIKQVWPQDVEVEGENDDACLGLRFLHASLQTSCKSHHPVGDMSIRPYVPNTNFVLGKEIYPPVGKLGVWICPLQTPSRLRAYIWCQLVLADRIFANPCSDWSNFLLLLVCEPLALLWPPSYVAKCLRSYPTYRRSRFARLTRLVGKLVVVHETMLLDLQFHCYAEMSCPRFYLHDYMRDNIFSDKHLSEQICLQE